MAKIKTSELIDAALDWVVQEIEYQRMVAEGEHVKQWALDDHRAGASINRYSTDWLWGGPIIAREGIAVLPPVIRRIGAERHAFPVDYWRAMLQRDENESATHGRGPTPLIAAMRCFCCSKLGDTVEVPEALT